MKKALKILLAEDIPSLNKGEAAIFFGMLESFNLLGDFHFVNLTKYVEDVRNYENDKCTIICNPTTSKKLLPYAAHVLMLFVSGLLKRCKFRNKLFVNTVIEPLNSFEDADVILIGHDNVFATCSLRSFLTNAVTIVYAKLSGKKTVSYGASIGPYEEPSDLKPDKYGDINDTPGLMKRILIILFKRLIVNQVDLITLRDVQSYEYLKTQKMFKPVRVLTTDLAFMLKPAPKEDVEKYLCSKKINASRSLIGLTATRYLAAPMKCVNGEYFPSFESRYEKYCKLMADLVDKMVESFDVSVVLVSHVIGPGIYQDDRSVNNDIFELVKNKKRVVKIEEDLSTKMLKGIIGRLDLLVGARTHSLIAAASQGVPVIGLTNRNRYKTIGIIGNQLGQDRFLLNVEEIEPNNLFDTVKDAYRDRVSISEELLRNMKSVRIAAENNGRCLRGVIKR